MFQHENGGQVSGAGDQGLSLDSGCGLGRWRQDNESHRSADEFAEYRLSTEAIFPAAIYDVKAARATMDGASQGPEISL
jgi:hypothetical protein